MPAPGPAELLAIAAILGMIALPVVGLVLLVRSLDARGRPSADPAMDALRTRFANGDIDEAEFERLRSVLQRH